MKIPRGVRNNNPGNIVITHIPWYGKVPVGKNTDGKFEQFVKMEFGIRAMMMDIRSDMTKKGMNTVKKLISSYAPPSENDTQSYINAVAKSLGVGIDTPLTADKKTLTGLAGAIIRHENGGMWGISEEQINRAWEML